MTDGLIDRLIEARDRFLRARGFAGDMLDQMERGTPTRRSSDTIYVALYYGSLVVYEMICSLIERMGVFDERYKSLESRIDKLNEGLDEVLRYIRSRQDDGK